MPINNIALIISSLEFFVILFAAIIPFALLIIALVDLTKRDLPHSDKVIWTLIVIFTVILGPILYLTIGRRRYPKTLDHISSWTL